MTDWKERAKSTGLFSGIVTDWTDPSKSIDRYEQIETIRKALPPFIRCKIVNFTNDSIKESFKKAQRFLLSHGVQLYLEKEQIEKNPPKVWEVYPLAKNRRIMSRADAARYAEDGILTFFMFDESDYHDKQDGGEGHNGFCQYSYKPRYILLNNDPKRKGDNWSEDYLAERIVHEVGHLLGYLARVEHDLLHQNDYDKENITNWLIYVMQRIGHININNEYTF